VNWICDCCEVECGPDAAQHVDAEYGSMICGRCFEELGGTMNEPPTQIFESPEEAAALEALLDAEFPEEGRRYDAAVQRILIRSRRAADGGES